MDVLECWWSSHLARIRTPRAAARSFLGKLGPRDPPAPRLTSIQHHLAGLFVSQRRPIASHSCCLLPQPKAFPTTTKSDIPYQHPDLKGRKGKINPPPALCLLVFSGHGTIVFSWPPRPNRPRAAIAALPRVSRKPQQTAPPSCGPPIVKRNLAARLGKSLPSTVCTAQRYLCEVRRLGRNPPVAGPVSAPFLSLSSPKSSLDSRECPSSRDCFDIRQAPTCVSQRWPLSPPSPTKATQKIR